jgi:hypothetical protein
MAKNKSRNIQLLKSVKDLKNEISFSKFDFKKYFSHLCDLIPDKKNENLEIKVVDKNNIQKKGLVYVFVIEGKIFKIGHTINNIIDRVQSYNCGKTEYRMAGTCSTTNYFVLQSLLNINKIVKVYAYFPNLPKYKVFGKKFQDNFPVYKRAEKEILKFLMDKYKKIPIGCTQK